MDSFSWVVLYIMSQVLYITKASAIAFRNAGLSINYVK